MASGSKACFLFAASPALSSGVLPPFVGQPPTILRLIFESEIVGTSEAETRLPTRPLCKIFQRTMLAIKGCFEVSHRQWVRAYNENVSLERMAPMQSRGTTTNDFRRLPVSSVEQILIESRCQYCGSRIASSVFEGLEEMEAAHRVDCSRLQ